MLVRLWRRGSPLTLLVGIRKGTTTVENSVECPREVKNRGSLGGAVVSHLPSAQGAILETQDRILHRAPVAWSLLLPLPVSLPLSLSLCDYHKKILKKKLKVELPYHSKFAQLGIYPEDTKVV